MRVAQVSPLYESVPPRLYGGTERVVSYLTEELVSQGHDVTLFASGDSRTSARLIAPCEHALRLGNPGGKDAGPSDLLAPHFALVEDVFDRLDEFDAVTTNHNFGLEFFSFLRFLANHYNVAYVTSSARDLQTLCHNKEIADSPFFNIFSTIRLSTLQREEAEELIRVPSERAGRPLAAYAARIMEMSGLFPFFIQMACSHVFEWMEEHPQAVSPDFDAIQRRFYEEAQLHYRSIWDGFDTHEKSAMRRVATGKSIPDALRHVVAELGSKRYVSDQAGKSRLFAAPFEDFVRSQPRALESGSRWNRWFGRGA